MTCLSYILDTSTTAVFRGDLVQVCTCMDSGYLLGLTMSE